MVEKILKVFGCLDKEKPTFSIHDCCSVDVINILQIDQMRSSKDLVDACPDPKETVGKNLISFHWKCDNCMKSL